FRTTESSEPAGGRADISESRVLPCARRSSFHRDRVMYIYLWAKVLHVFFVIAWMATVFGLPRILLELAEPANDAAVRDQLIRSGRRLYFIGHNLFGGAFGLGLVLWLYVGIGGRWLHVKLVLVALLLTHFTVCG